jgi:hypothetical protein
MRPVTHARTGQEELDDELESLELWAPKPLGSLA